MGTQTIDFPIDNNQSWMILGSPILGTPHLNPFNDLPQGQTSFEIFCIYRFEKQATQGSTASLWKRVTASFP